MYLSALRRIPRPTMGALQRVFRSVVDAPFCASEHRTTPFGKDNVWHICTRGFPGHRLVVYSGGVGADVSTELELVRYFDCDVFLFDPSPTGRATMERGENQHPRVHYAALGLARTTGTVRFDAPASVAEGSFRRPIGSAGALVFPCVSLVDHAREHGHSVIDLLKLDIEGFEYEVLADLLASEIVVSQLCVELHPDASGTLARCGPETLRALANSGYRIIHRNGLDYTFLRTGG